MSTYEYVPSRAGLGWTGTFSLPGQAQRLSNRSCGVGTGEDVRVCARPEEYPYMQRIGCTPDSEMGVSECVTEGGYAGTLHCCSREVLRGAMQAAAEPPPAQPPPAQPPPPSDAGAGLAALIFGRTGAMILGGLVLAGGTVLAYRWWESRKETPFQRASRDLWEADRPYREAIARGAVAAAERA